MAKNKKLLFRLVIVFIVIIIVFFVLNREKDIFCGGIEGIQCPNNYECIGDDYDRNEQIEYCEHFPFDFRCEMLNNKPYIAPSDAGGFCRKVQKCKIDFYWKDSKYCLYF